MRKYTYEITATRTLTVEAETEERAKSIAESQALACCRGFTIEEVDLMAVETESGEHHPPRALS